MTDQTSTFHAWERVNSLGDTRVYRMTVPGGWLYHIEVRETVWVKDDHHREGGYEDDRLLSTTATYVPDPQRAVT